MKYVVCYSGGHSSAMCAVEAARKYGKENVILLNHDICERVEDADIKRFKKEVADYLGVTVTQANMPGVEDKDQFDVCMELMAFKYGIQSSALCTQKLKTEPFKKWLDENYPSQPFVIRDDIVVLYGFDKNETVRMTRRVEKMAELGYAVDFPMIWKDRTIHNIEEIGIPRPRTYETFKHANCIGCLKSGKQHWFGVYCLYPQIWEKAKQAESVIGYSILREKFLCEYEVEFEQLKQRNFKFSENISPQRFWATARKLIKDDDILPCECPMQREASDNDRSNHLLLGHICSRPRPLQVGAMVGKKTAPTAAATASESE